MATEIKKLWTVESGSYSDHCVHAVFEHEADANAWRDAIANGEDRWNSDAYVGSMMMIAPGTAPYKVTTWQQNVELWDDGRTETRGPTSQTAYPIVSIYSPPPVRPAVRYVRAPIHGDRGGRLEVIAATRELVEKVVADRIAMWKAGAWAGKPHRQLNEEVDA